MSARLFDCPKCGVCIQDDPDSICCPSCGDNPPPDRPLAEALPALATGGERYAVEAAAQAAYRAGYQDGYVDAVCPEGTDDEATIHRQIDSAAMADGWANNRDQILALTAPQEPQTRPEGDGWRPIETAPKDGTLILAGSINHGAREVVCWQDGLPSGSQTIVYEPEEGWVNSDRFYANPHWFTHWMPLPEAPQEGVSAPLVGKGLSARSLPGSDAGTPAPRSLQAPHSGGGEG